MSHSIDELGEKNTFCSNILDPWTSGTWCSGLSLWQNARQSFNRLSSKRHLALWQWLLSKYLCRRNGRDLFADTRASSVTRCRLGLLLSSHYVTVLIPSKAPGKSLAPRFCSWVSSGCQPWCLSWDWSLDIACVFVLKLPFWSEHYCSGLSEGTLPQNAS